MTKRFLTGLATVEKVVSCVLLGGLLVSVILQVVSRYVFHAPLPWADEVSRFLLVWLTFVAAAYVMAERMHVTVDLALAKLGVRTVAAVDTLATVVVVVAAGVMTVAGIILVRETAGVLAPATQFPMPVLYSAGAVGFGLILLHGVATIIQNIRDPRSVPGAAESLEEGGL